MSNVERSILCAMLMLPVLSLTSCAEYAQVQSDLTEQARHGVAMIAESSSEKDKIVQSYYATQRKQLDDAFDADVRSQPALSPDWVIDSRRAYAAAIDALDQQTRAAQQNAAADRSNQNATDQALQKMIWLQSLPSQFFSFLKGIL